MSDHAITAGRADGLVGSSRFLTPAVFALTLAFYWLWSRTNDVGWLDILGPDSFLVVNRINIAAQVHWLFPLAGDYLAQFGLQGVLAGGLHRLLGLSVTETVAIMAAGGAMLTAATFALIVPYIFRAGGVTALILFWFALALSPWLERFSVSLYWMPATLIAPFVYGLLFGKHWGGRRSSLWFLVGLAGVYLVRCLCGYEYITTTALLAVAGFWLSSERSLLENAKGSAAVLVACVLAFAISVGLHFAQIELLTSASAVQEVLSRATKHTGTTGAALDVGPLSDYLRAYVGHEAADAIVANSSDRWAVASTAFLLYFQLPFIGAGTTYTLAVLAISALFIVPGYVAIVAGTRDRQSVALAAAVTLSFLAAVSWQILAWRHMTLHYHLNGIVFAIAFVPLLAVLAGSIIDRIATPLYQSVNKAAVGAVILAIAAGFCAYWALSGIRSGGADLLLNAAPSERLVGRIDRVLIDAAPANSEFSRGLQQPSYAIEVGGWALNLDGHPVAIDVYSGGTVIRTIYPALRRPDVAAATGGPEASGFFERIILAREPPLDGIEFMLRENSFGGAQIKLVCETCALPKL